jgi:mannose-6-phosphate isomerase-like protein (cupin superfamily)
MTLTRPMPAAYADDVLHLEESDPRTGRFAADGFLGPLRLFTPAECRRIAAYCHQGQHPAPADWPKGRAVHERFMYDVATHPAILSLLKPLLGDDLVLWGAQTVTRGPGAVHPWHSDMESARPEGGFVSVWVGIEHTSRESALQVISRSHRLGRTVQEARLERGIRREAATPEAMLAAAREHDAEAALLQPDMTNGEAIVFDGRLWHGSDNSRKQGQRLALLLQYAAADVPVRIPDTTQLDWPFCFRTTPRPAAILVSGSDRSGANRLVPPPPPFSNGVSMVVTAIHHFELPLEQPTRPWQPFSAFRGPTRTFTDMSCHASVLVPGHSPHLPHSHREEELLIPLHGEVEILIARSEDDPAPRVERLRPGSFVYYPAWQYHTIRNAGTAPVGYLMFKWDAAASGARTPLGTGIYHTGDAAAPAGAAGFWTHRIFEGPTGWLGKLHSHLTVLQPGGGYESHVDAYDVAIVVLEGAVETLGQRVEPQSVIYYAAGEPHGMRNVGTTPARYLVFEFHAPGVVVVPPEPPFHRRVLRLGKRLARPLWHRVKPVLAAVRGR